MASDPADRSAGSVRETITLWSTASTITISQLPARGLCFARKWSQEFSLLQNQFSAEFGRSNGGQFITVTKSGSNDYHGSFYGVFRNRYLNALDTREIEEGKVREKNVPGRPFMPREDFFRGGVNVSGPLHLPRFGEGGPSIYNGKDRLFFFTSYERLQAGFATVPGGHHGLTAAGLATVAGTPGVSANQPRHLP